MGCEFKLYFYQEDNVYKELLILPYGYSRSYIPLFGITNTLHHLVSSYGAISSKSKATRVLERFLGKFNADQLSTDIIEEESKNTSLRKIINAFKNNEKPSVIDAFANPLDFEIYGLDLTLDKRLQYEHQAMNYMFNTLLIPESGANRLLKPSEKYANLLHTQPQVDMDQNNFEFWVKMAVSSSEGLYDLESRILPFLPHLVRYHRYLQFSQNLGFVIIEDESSKSKIINKKPIPAELFISRDGLLPLIWAEIFFAIKNDIPVGNCAVCGDFFPITKGKFNQLYCKNPEKNCEYNAKRERDKDKSIDRVRQSRQREKEARDLLKKGDVTNPEELFMYFSGKMKFDKAKEIVKKYRKNA